MPPAASDVQCPDCRKTFSSKYALAAHRQRCRGPAHRSIASGTSTCHQCQRVLSSPYKLAAHLKICRGTKRPPPASTTCELCQRSLSSSYALRRHQLTCTGPPSPRPFQCVDCGYTTPRRYLMTRHKKTCRPTLRCPHGGACQHFRFAHDSHLQCHLRVVHGGRENPI